jgi:hypothetical protein
MLLIEAKDKFITDYEERIKADEIKSDQLLQRQNAASSQKDREIQQLQTKMQASEIQSQLLIKEKKDISAEMQARDREIAQLK